MILFSLQSADRRATARTTNFVEPCSFQQKKEALAAAPHAQCADPAWCYHNLEKIEGSKNTKRGFGVPAVLQGLTPLGDICNSQKLSVFCHMPKERLRTGSILELTAPVALVGVLDWLYWLRYFREKDI